jgi:flagellar protein FlaJ
MIISQRRGERLSRRLTGAGGRLSRIFRIEKHLKESGLDILPGEYLALSLLNAIILFIVFFPLFSWAFYLRLEILGQALGLGLAAGFGISLMFFMVYTRYPRVIAGKKGERINKNLVFVLKDMLLQVSSGVSLYNSMINIANSDYGEVSREFEKAVKRMDSGMSVENALEQLAVESKSEYLRRTVWLILSTIKAGASLRGALKSIINDLSRDQRSNIRSYAQELNMWSLIYMLFAVAIPTIGITFLIILSSFAGMGITEITLLMFISMAIIVQFVMIGFVKSRRPVVEF